MIEMGRCCACGCENETVCNVILTGLILPPKYRGQRAGSGCLVCGQPFDEAVAIICDKCLESRAEFEEIRLGGSLAGQYIPFADLPGGRIYHNILGHPEVWPKDCKPAHINDIGVLMFSTSPDFGLDECLCSLCCLPIKDVGLRAWADREQEARFHFECAWHVGLTEEKEM
jgi:hypothetical protein